MSGQRLAGRKALVTGGARGIGAAIAEALAKAGAAVMIGDVLADVGRDTAANIARHGVKAGFAALDVTNESQWEQAVASTVATLGGFDILINNAGIEITSLVVDLRAEDLRRMCDVNVVGVALGLKNAFRAMRPGGAAGNGGSVVNISSVAATIAFPAIAGYSATKSAVDRLTRIAAMESGKLGYGVRVNCIYPGLIPTVMGMQLANDIVAVVLLPTSMPPSRASSNRRRSGASPRFPISRTPPCFSAPTTHASSPARVCRSMAAWACEGILAASQLPSLAIVLFGALRPAPPSVPAPRQSRPCWHSRARSLRAGHSSARCRHYQSRRVRVLDRVDHAFRSAAPVRAHDLAVIGSRFC